GAAEPFTRTEMSKEMRAQLTSVLDDYFAKSYVGAIVSGRSAKNWDDAHVRKLIDEGPYTAKAALAAGLIDRTAYADQLPDLLKEALQVDKVRVSKNYGQAKGEELDLSNPFNILKLLSPPKEKVSTKPKVAVIYAVGEIVTGKGGESLLGLDLVG